MLAHSLWDHPRMCGDHLRPNYASPLTMGSFSHVRGPLNSFKVLTICCGITPACAGTTRHSWKPHNSTWDHPRMCGDHCFTAMPLYIFLGSPPHVRGPRNGFLTPESQKGITPACAGTTPRQLC